MHFQSLVSRENSLVAFNVVTSGLMMGIMVVMKPMVWLEMLRNIHICFHSDCEYALKGLVRLDKRTVARVGEEVRTAKPSVIFIPGYGSKRLQVLLLLLVVWL